MKRGFVAKYIFIFLVGALLIPSCTMQKRKYLKGFYSERIGKKQDNKTDASKILSEYNSNSTNQYQAFSNNKVELVAESENVLGTNFAVANCDTIFLNNGVKMIVKVISAGEQTVIYKSCESTKDEFLNIERSKVSSIHYSNGNKTDENNAANDSVPGFDEPYKHFNSAKNAEAEKGVRQLEKATTWFMISRYIGFGFIIGFIFATCAKNNLKDKVGYESEFKTAKFLHILGLVLLLIMLLPFIYILVMALLI